MSGIGMRVYYRSGDMVVKSRVGTVEQERRRRNGGAEYLVRWEDGETSWYLARNLKFGEA